MRIFKTRIIWLFYVVCAVLFFFYTLFPADTIKEYLADQVRQMHPDITVKIGRVKPAFPPGLKLYEVRVHHIGRTVADLEKLKIAPDILSLFFDTTHLSFKGSGYGGNLAGGVDIIKKSPSREVMIDAEFTGIQINRVEILQTLSTHKISGNLEGTLALKALVPRQTLAGNLILTEGQIELSPPVLNQNILTFDTIDAEIELNGLTLDIKQCLVEGNELDAEISGSITLAGRGPQKILDLSGTVQPHEELLSRLGKNLQSLLAGKNLENRGFPFKIRGPIDSPKYSFY